MVELGVDLAMVAAPANAAPQEVFCFDCPTAADYLGIFVGLVGTSLVFSIPSFFLGVLVHRVWPRRSSLFRIIFVVFTVVPFWFVIFLLFGRASSGGDFWARLAKAAGQTVDAWPILLGASLFVATASFFDALRVRKAQSSAIYSRYE